MSQESQIIILGDVEGLVLDSLKLELSTILCDNVSNHRLTECAVPPKPIFNI